MNTENVSFDVLVVGAGHAGIEAANAAARMGRRVGLLTASLDSIGRMSCNPAIGGLAKGQLVREIDALGGLMGLLADRAGIQFKVLNRSRGPAVWGPRAQCDKALYARLASDALASTPGLTLIEGMAEDLVEAGGRVSGVIASAAAPGGAGGTTLRIGADAVVVAGGTFLRGLMHTGGVRTPGGRVGEPAAVGLSGALSRAGLALGRFKTGTPPRVARDTVDFAACAPQAGDEPPIPFSYRTKTLPRNQTLCWITSTNESVHRIIRDNLDSSPMFSGAIRSVGPRYCPSVEDKVVRFAAKSAHTLYLEPEGLDAEEIYINGLSTSLPAEIQRRILAEIPGLSRARMLRAGYAVEYDYAFPDQLSRSLEVLAAPGLFLAGQINGTSGYEEAAGQGLWAGVNAALAARREAPFVLERSEAYAAVMVDDLTSKGLEEPYRLFTSRAEHRLLLGVDTVLRRLLPHARRLGLIDDSEYGDAMRSEDRVARADRDLATRTVHPNRQTLDRLMAATGARFDSPTTLRNLLKRQDLSAAALAAFAPEAFEGLTLEELQIVETRVRYEGYVRREQERILRVEPLETRRIPDELDYAILPGLTTEIVEKCTRRRPRTLGEAARIPGVTPAAVAIISGYVARRGRGASRAL
ncbi:MAG: tRNA uridine-5-carboxymethylaminomethyl(34) synthesis enzyme MnmG [Thermoanaerobaculia bacterium]